MTDGVLFGHEEKYGSSVEHYREELMHVRIGRVNPTVFGGVVAEYYGVPTLTAQIAAISIPEPRMLLVKSYELSVVGDIENAIHDSDLSVNPVNNDQVLCVTIPQLAGERHRGMIKVSHSKGKDIKIAIHNVHRKGMEALKRIQRDGDVGENEAQASEKGLDRVTRNCVEQMDSLAERKETEPMEI